MPPRQSNTRRRLIGAAAEMLARHGLNATSIREMAKRARAPLGSTYHYFPGGKQQLVTEAVQSAGASTKQNLELHLSTGLTEGLATFLSGWRQTLISSKFRIGCPVMGAAVEEPIDPIDQGALDAAAGAFDSWRYVLTKSLTENGADNDTAVDVATLVVCSIEGAIVLCRASRSIEPFDRVAKQIDNLLRNH